MTILPLAIALLIFHRALRVPPEPELSRDRSRCNSR